jgi:hypothetical protein
MPEILTESFCERCGTRYTFESTAPRKTRRLGQFKTLSKGLKNYVLSDDTSMDEAMAAARSDEERELTTQQLDAFHATFNFCMNCRQYTCSNCWNATEGRCLTCAPNLGHEILPAPFPESAPFQPVSSITADAWPTADLPQLDIAADAHAAHAGNGSNGFSSLDEALAARNSTAAEAPAESFDAIARLAFLAGEPAAGADDVVAAEPDPAEIVAADEPIVTADEPIVTAGASAVPADEPVVAEAALAEPFAPAPTAAPEPLPEAVDDRAQVLADHTQDLLGRFRPGQNIDAELAAYEAELDAVEEPVAATSAGATEQEPLAPPDPAVLEPEPALAATVPNVAAEVAPEPEIAAIAEPEPEPLVAAAEAEQAVAQPEPVAAEPVAAEPVAAEPEPVSAAPEPAPVSPAPELPRHDRVEQPTWRIFAPDQTAPADRQPILPPVAPPSAPPASASAEPQWPTRPEFQDSPSMALLANRSRSDGLWAASAQEVLSPAAGPSATATSGVQPCSNCGLSLSATARFCRRCGTRQG